MRDSSGVQMVNLDQLERNQDRAAEAFRSKVASPPAQLNSFTHLFEMLD